MRFLLAALSMVFLAEGARTSTGVENLEMRLEELQPAEPIEYFLLAEEVAYERTAGDGVSLATHLFVLAYGLNERDGGDETLSRAVCLALADLSTDPLQRRWLLSLAEVLDASTSATLWEESMQDDSTMSARFEFAEMLGLYRAGRYREVSNLLEDDAILSVARDYEAFLPGGLGAIEAAVHGLPTCRECHNRRIVQSKTDPTGAPVLCYTCAGDPGPRLSDDALARHLQVESLLLDGSANSWAIEARAGMTTPLRDLDPGSLTDVFSVDVSAPWRRNGVWVADPGASSD